MNHVFLAQGVEADLGISIMSAMIQSEQQISPSESNVSLSLSLKFNSKELKLEKRT